MSFAVALSALLLSADVSFPTVLDERLQLQLVAAEPDVVTPTGIAVDSKGRVLVIESHTHFRPKDYEGPAADRILMLEDFDPETGRARKRSVFFEGMTHTMSLAVFYDGSVYVATRMEIFRLRDRDRDGKADERTPICHLETKGNYPHNGLSGFAFDFAGNVFFGFGENLGAPYELVGSDGKKLRGGGEGGNIYACDSEGRNLCRVATGFWNPFHLCFDAFGRLFAVDNDPDSRPPCRLLHVVEGGDYGFKFRNGRKGVHPFTAWNGELPGTLPMVSGTGEAPCAVMAYESDNLPADYRGDLLVTSWGDHRLERYRLTPRGASFTATMTPVVRGDQNFRPVGLAMAPDGSLFFSDWVDKSYPLHGKGRVWRLSAKQPEIRLEPISKKLVLDEIMSSLKSPHGPTRFQTVWRMRNDRWAIRSGTELSELEGSADSRLAAIGTMAHWASFWPRVDDPLEPSREIAVLLHLSDLDRGANTAPKENDPIARMEQLKRIRSMKTARTSSLTNVGALFSTNASPAAQAAALRCAMIDLPDRLEAAGDADPFVRQAAIQGDLAKLAAASRIDFNAKKGPQRLAIALAKRQHDPAGHQAFIPILLDDTEPDVQLVGIQWVGEEIVPEYLPLVEALLTRASSRRVFQACLAAIHEVKGGPRGPRGETAGEEYVVKALLDEKTVPAVRRLALRSVSPANPQLTDDRLLSLLRDEDRLVRLEAIRTLRERGDHRWPQLQQIAANEAEDVQARCEAVLTLSPDNADERLILLHLVASGNREVAAEAGRALRGHTLNDAEKGQVKIPDAEVLSSQMLGLKDDELWQALVNGDGDAAAGERIFFSRLGMCSRCHEYEGRGARVGPDLSTTGRSMTRERLLQSIVDPSREVAPQFTSFTILKQDGNVLTGMHVGDEVDGRMRFLDAAGREFHVHPNEIDRREPSAKSIMPEGVVNNLTAQELRDLLAFLLKSN